MSGEQKYKEGDALSQTMEATNKSEVIVFTNKQQVYKFKVSEFEDSKASVLGAYLPTKLNMEEGEAVIYLCIPGDYSGSILFFYESGKVAKVELSGYDTKSNRRRLTGAYSDKTPLAGIMLLKEDTEIALYSTEGRVVIFNSALLTPKSARTTQGVNIMTLKAKYKLRKAARLDETTIVNLSRYRARSLPAAGALLKEEDMEEKQVALEL